MFKKPFPLDRLCRCTWGRSCSLENIGNALKCVIRDLSGAIFASVSGIIVAPSGHFGRNRLGGGAKIVSWIAPNHILALSKSTGNEPTRGGMVAWVAVII